jgi:hypothetical protein
MDHVGAHGARLQSTVRAGAAVLLQYSSGTTSSSNSEPPMVDDGVD